MQQNFVRIQNEVGLHARPAAQFVKLAKRFNSKVTVTYNGKIVDAKSLVRLLSIGAGKDAEIEITTDGIDEQEAASSLVGLIQNNFIEK
ncbi:HPr family phosphocarrier protein [Dictyobacter kobayashii]|uniref:Phosphocarrier protein HPr n=1 Tax=Dictyobacter kobayashii TaxID=2014872 RepID=A0A402AMK8_9CHLR|nr:HPr family phosphocarrier protein [Dictyobacter kobayashii]GCE20264.1 phosphocarrier protein HPr [Dictyobacter kobayashii]